MLDLVYPDALCIGKQRFYYSQTIKKHYIKFKIMKNLQSTLSSPATRIAIILGVVALILSIPLIAMQFTNEVKWDLTDFMVAGTLLLSTGLAIELVIRNLKTGTLRTVILLIILLALFLIWAELAVGIFGTPFAGS